MCRVQKTVDMLEGERERERERERDAVKVELYGGDELRLHSESLPEADLQVFHA
jgi:hypothetical protein